MQRYSEGEGEKDKTWVKLLNLQLRVFSRTREKMISHRNRSALRAGGTSMFPIKQNLSIVNCVSSLRSFESDTIPTSNQTLQRNVGVIANASLNMFALSVNIQANEADTFRPYSLRLRFAPFTCRQSISVSRTLRVVHLFLAHAKDAAKRRERNELFYIEMN